MKRFSAFVFSFSLCFTLLAAGAYAQAPAGRLYVLDEGPFSGQGLFGYVDYPSAQFHLLDTVPGGGNIIGRNGCKLYVVAGSGTLLVFDQLTKTFTDTVMVQGARAVAFWKNQLLVSANAKPFFHVFDMSNGYAPVYTLDQTKIRSAAEAVAVVGDSAFLALSYDASTYVNDTLVAVVNLNQQDTVKTIRVPRNPVAFVQYQGLLYVASQDYDSSAGHKGLIITELNPKTLTVQRTDTSHILSYGIFELSGDRIFFGNNEYVQTNGIHAYHPGTHRFDTLNVLDGYFYGFDAFNGGPGEVWFVSQTDYFSYGSVSSVTQGMLRDTAMVGISPRSILFEPYLPAPTAVANGSVCEGDTVKLNGSGGLNGANYIWNGPAGFSSGMQNPLQAPATLQMSGDYTLMYALNGCVSSWDTVTVAVNSLPAVPSITRQGNALSTSSSGTLQWLDAQGNPISGENGQSFSPSLNGDYSVRVTNGSGCASLSAPYSFIATAVSEIAFGSLRAYPNPTTHYLNVEGLTAGTQAVLLDVNGRQQPAPFKHQAGGLGQVDLSALAPGVYLLRLQAANAVHTLRVVKQ